LFAFLEGVLILYFSELQLGKEVLNGSKACQCAITLLKDVPNLRKSFGMSSTCFKFRLQSVPISSTAHSTVFLRQAVSSSSERLLEDNFVLGEIRECRYVFQNFVSKVFVAVSLKIEMIVGGSLIENPCLLPA
jgi:hypothetical protein